MDQREQEITTEEEVVLTPEEQAAIDDTITLDNDGDVQLPSDGDGKLAGKYETVEDLKQGIANLKSELPQYIIDGMNDKALEQHYLELQKTFSAPKEEETPKEKEETDRKHKVEDKQLEDAKKATKGKVDWTSIDNFFAENNGLEDSHYDELEKAGIPAHVVDNYIDGLAIKAQAFTQQVIDLAGGREEFDAIKAWAEDGGIEPSENDYISSLKGDAQIAALKSVKARYDIAENKAPVTRLQGETTVTSGDQYSTQNDYIIDVSDSRYGMDDRYTAKVNDKFARSKALQ